jgi:leader peptidase (prepilin peptidase) / N-methyltransferase
MEPSDAAVAATLERPDPVPAPKDPAQAPADQTPLLRHPLPVAAVAIVVAAVAFACYPAGPRAVLAAFFAAVLVVLSATDLDRRVIPNVIVLPATVIVLIAHIAIAPGRTVELIVAPLAAALFLFLPNLINSSAMGMGDVKLALLLGAGLGWGVIGALLVGFLAVLPFAVAALVRGGRAARTASLPLGPFLAFGGLVILIVPKL